MNFYGIIIKPLSELCGRTRGLARTRLARPRVCETQHGAVCHDDPALFISLSLSYARAPLLPHVHARLYYIPGAFSQIELYRLEN